MPRRHGLSLVVSSRARTADLAKTLRHYVQRSGLSVSQIQVLVFENPGRWGLSTLYNRALSQAAFEVVCFLHDDLHFLRGARWGEQVLTAFRDTDFAALSAAGSVSLATHGVFWEPREHLVGRVKHRLPPPAHRLQLYDSFYSGAFEVPLPVWALDGLFLAVHRSRLALNPPFDEDFAFHFYDLSFALRQSEAQPGTCGVLTRLRIVHHSTGQPNTVYHQARQHFVRKYAAALPRFLPSPPQPPPLPQRVQRPSELPPHIQVQPFEALLKASAAQFAAWQAAVVPEQLYWVVAGAFQWPIQQSQQSQQSQQGLWALDGEWQRAHYGPVPWGILAPRLHYADTHLLFHGGFQATPQGDWLERGAHQPYAYTLKPRRVDGVLAAAVLVRGSLWQQALAQPPEVNQTDLATALWRWGQHLGTVARQQGLALMIAGNTWGLWHAEP